jgi:arylsulfatase A-like enzyme
MRYCPNVILFLSDDHASWATGCYGNSDVRTPNIDFLAQEGVQMLNAFTPTPVCSPARACLMTGRLASQHGVHDYIGTTEQFDVDYNWMQDETLLPQLFQAAGYETILIGKWHLGQERTEKQGFDQSFTFGPEYPIYHQGTRTWYRNGKAEQHSGVLSEIITEEALHFLKTRTSSKPFFLVVGHYATHSPWKGHKESMVQNYKNKALAIEAKQTQYPYGILVNEAMDKTRENPVEARCEYYAGVEEIDNSVGTILAQLKFQDLLNKSWLIYTSDHGLNCGQHGLWGKGNATFPLNMVEESIRIPLIFYAPKFLLPKQKRTEFVDHTDVFNTIVDLASLSDPEEETRNSPGSSFLPLLTNTYPLGSKKSIQFGEYGPVRMARTNRYKLICFPDSSQNLFFDMEKDIEECINLYGKPEHRSTIEHLKREIQEHFSRYFVGTKQGTDPGLPQYNPHVAWDYFKENNQ